MNISTPNSMKHIVMDFTGGPLTKFLDHEGTIYEKPDMYTNQVIPSAYKVGWRFSNGRTMETYATRHGGYTARSEYGLIGIAFVLVLKSVHFKNTVLRSSVHSKF